MGNPHAIRLVTVDAQAIFRAGIRQLCSAVPDIVVAGEAGRGGDALVLCERLQPDLLLLDGALSGAVSLIAQLREHHRAVGVVVFADRVDDVLVHRALQLGVTGYLLKQIEAFDLIQAIRSVARGHLTLAPEIAAVAFRADRPEAELDALSEREQMVLALLLNGLPNDAIAARLRVSRATVKFHLRNIYGKLGVRTRTEALATVFGQRRGAVLRQGDAAPASEADVQRLLLRRRALAAAV